MRSAKKVSVALCAVTLIAAACGSGHHSSAPTTTSPTVAATTPATTAAPVTTAPPITSAPTTSAPTTSTTVAATTAAIGGISCAPAPANPTPQTGPFTYSVSTASAGTVRLTGSYTVASGGGGSGPFIIHNLQVTRSGGSSFTSAINLPPSASPINGESQLEGVQFTSTLWQGTLFCVADFVNQPPTAILSEFTEGAHCCEYAAGIPLSGPDAGQVIWAQGGSHPFNLVDHNNSPLEISADGSFDYQFASYAGSYAPIQVWEMQNGKWVNTTRQHLDLVGADSQKAWNLTLQYPKDILGPVAGWAADECLLGNSAHVTAVLNQLNAQGKLVGEGGDWPGGTAFITALRKQLSQEGYC